MKLKIFIMLFAFAAIISAQNKSAQKKDASITFIEIGSTTCIPCKQMAKVIESVEKRYAGTLHVIFYNTNDAAQKQTASKYKYKLIPTQIFLDASGKEFYRHEGFLPEKEIDKLLKSKGITPLPGK